MLPILRSERAKSDILDIWLYIAERENPEIADRFLAKLYLAIERIATFPQAGPVCSHIYPDIRRSIYGSYLIYYLVHSDHIEIARILHGSRDQMIDYHK
ncbi:hypothetical protein CCAX7_47480 [Capsulimonas corticalis]|uniref:Uncharacterized protein n=1 Tax=Capsulimonas corticalis TaxID=2219043 RepID=A0A402CQ55_9BACT|nr:type II toxin-antitoxin system RelE/ParE family toxin [Capsulimonas corticalis]BDI32697.1 hypothetical protein CCAX7_47480 [Capsulimonas corticalis]